MVCERGLSVQSNRQHEGVTFVQLHLAVAIRWKIWAPYFSTIPIPTPGTASKSESLLGQVLAILRRVRSPKMRKAGIFLRLASVKRQARNACSSRAWRSGGGASDAAAAAAAAARFLARFGVSPGAAASLITNR